MNILLAVLVNITHEILFLLNSMVILRGKKPKKLDIHKEFEYFDTNRTFENWDFKWQLVFVNIIICFHAATTYVRDRGGASRWG